MISKANDEKILKIWGKESSGKTAKQMDDVQTDQHELILRNWKIKANNRKEWAGIVKHVKKTAKPCILRRLLIIAEPPITSTRLLTLISGLGGDQ